MRDKKTNNLGWKKKMDYRRGKSGIGISTRAIWEYGVA
jgi:hypothetical protein